MHRAAVFAVFLFALVGGGAVFGFLPAKVTVAQPVVDPAPLPVGDPKAAVVTLMAFAGLTAAVFISGKDFSFLGPVLWVAALGALGVIVASIIFGFTLGIVWAYVMVVLAAGFIVYDTSNVMHHYRTDEHVAAALALFASVALMFWYVLRIFMYSGNND
jgi:FtsH-binding integral membrane protein